MQCKLWSFVRHKGNQQWLWLARDRESREIVGVAIGARDHMTAQALWDSLPPIYRQGAICASDFYQAYSAIVPSNHVERVTNTLRQRIGRLVRKTLAFSKKLANHIGAIWYFIHQYNATPKRGRA